MSKIVQEIDAMIDEARDSCYEPTLRHIRDVILRANQDWHKTLDYIHSVLTWRRFLVECHNRRMRVQEAPIDEHYIACTIWCQDTAFAHVIYPRKVDENNLIEVHLFFHNRMHGLYTHRSLDKVPNFICCAVHYAEQHPHMFDSETLYPDAYDHTDPFMRRFHDIDHKPFNVDDWPTQRQIS
jgi:hypothetical protein